MKRNFWVTFLLSFSFLVLLFGGYNCAQEQPYTSPKYPIGTGGVPVAPGTFADFQNPRNGINNPSSVANNASRGRYNDNRGLPSKPSGGCHSDDGFSMIQTKIGGAMTAMKIDSGGFIDYREGREVNFPIDCARVLVNLRKSKRGYTGKIAVSYKVGQQNYKYQVYETGSSEADIKYNDWKGSWSASADRNNILEPRFVAIAEDKNFGAIILHIKEVEQIDQEGGKNLYKGYGDIWFKPFKTYAGKSDVCYESGVFLSKARSKPPISSRRCWNNNIGPYSCLPNGINTSHTLDEDLDPNPSDNFGDLEPTCYQLLGQFLNLDITEAFNITGSRTDIRKLN